MYRTHLKSKKERRNSAVRLSGHENVWSSVGSKVKIDHCNFRPIQYNITLVHKIGILVNARSPPRCEKCGAFTGRVSDDAAADDHGEGQAGQDVQLRATAAGAHLKLKLSRLQTGMLQLPPQDLCQHQVESWLSAWNTQQSGNTGRTWSYNRYLMVTNKKKQYCAAGWSIFTLKETEGILKLAL